MWNRLKEINWDMWAFFAAVLTVVFTCLAYIFNPLKAFYTFLVDITKRDSNYNYYEMHQKVNEMWEVHKVKNSPELKEAKARIDKLEEEKELAMSEGFSKLEKQMSRLQEDFQEIKTQLKITK